MAGALEEREYDAKLRAAGFAEVEVEPWRIYDVEDARSFLTETGLDVDRLAGRSRPFRERLCPRAET